MANVYGNYDYFTIAYMKKKNDEEREFLKEEASKFSTEFDKMQFICQKFLKEYSFDYSVLNSVEELKNKRQPWVRKFNYNDELYECETWWSEDVDEKYGISLSPSVHALKLGTCSIFSKELKWFCEEFGIKCDIKNKMCNCYDGYESEIVKPKIRQMNHYYVIMNLDGNEYKVDVAGAMMAMDYKKKNPEIKLDPAEFMFVDKDKENVFDDLVKNSDEPK